MRVTVTGGSGFIGAHAVAALLTAGHEVRLLARDRRRVDAALDPLGVAVGDVVLGDMTDAEAVRAAVEGADAVVHAAAVVAPLDRRGATRTIEVNLRGTELVVDAAAVAGCTRIVYLSSVAALFSPKRPALTPDSPPAVDADSPYTRSKALTEQWVRQRQEAGVPVTIVYPGGVLGPAAGHAFGEASEGLVNTLKPAFVPLNSGIWPIIDVRDLALIIVAALEKGPPAARYLCAGRPHSLAEIAALLREVTGRRIVALPVPGALLRGTGRVVDGIRRVVSFETVFTREAMEILTLGAASDDRAVHEELGVDYRDSRETVAAAIRSLYDAGRLSARQAGRVARTAG